MLCYTSIFSLFGVNATVAWQHDLCCHCGMPFEHMLKQIITNVCLYVSQFLCALQNLKMRNQSRLWNNNSRTTILQLYHNSIMPESKQHVLRVAVSGKKDLSFKSFLFLIAITLTLCYLILLKQHYLHLPTTCNSFKNSSCCSWRCNTWTLYLFYHSFNCLFSHSLRFCYDGAK